MRGSHSERIDLPKKSSTKTLNGVDPVRPVKRTEEKGRNVGSTDKLVVKGEPQPLPRGSRPVKVSVGGIPKRTETLPDGRDSETRCKRQQERPESHHKYTCSYPTASEEVMITPRSIRVPKDKRKIGVRQSDRLSH